MTSWSAIARRVRIPLGFVFAVLYLWLATPTPKSAARPVHSVSPQDLAAAHEYLLSRSSSRSEEPVVVSQCEVVDAGADFRDDLALAALNIEAQDLAAGALGREQ